MPDKFGQPTLADIWADSSNRSQSIVDMLDKSQERNFEMSKMVKKSALDQQNELAKDKNKRLGESQQFMNMYGADNLQDALKTATARGQSVHVGDVSVGQDPYARMFAMGQKNANGAYQHAMDMYNKGLPKLQSAASAAQQGIEAINDPKQMGSVGQVRTQMLKAMGMSRYNDNEAAAVLPPTLYSFAKTLFNKVDSNGNFVGDGQDNNPLADNQKAAALAFFTGHLDNIRKQHDMLKSNAMNFYKMSPYFEASRGDQMDSNMGKPFEKFLGPPRQLPAMAPSMMEQQQPVPPPPAIKPQSGLGGFLNKLFGNQSSTPAPAPNSEEQEYQLLKQKYGR